MSFCEVNVSVEVRSSCVFRLDLSSGALAAFIHPPAGEYSILIWGLSIASRDSQDRLTW